MTSCLVFMYLVILASVFIISDEYGQIQMLFVMKDQKYFGPCRGQRKFSLPLSFQFLSVLRILQYYITTPDMLHWLIPDGKLLEMTCFSGRECINIFGQSSGEAG